MALVPLETEVFVSFREWHYASLDTEAACAYRTMTGKLNQTLQVSRSLDSGTGEGWMQNLPGAGTEVSLDGRFGTFLRMRLRLTME